MGPHKDSEHVHGEWRSRSFRILLGVFYLFALCVLVLWEYRDRLELLSPECKLQDETKSSLYNRPYSNFLKWTSPDTPGHVVAIAITADLEEIQSNVCLSRAYLADVLRVLEKKGPSVLVVDKYYSPNTCTADPASTRDLIDVVRGVGAPVVIGESTNGIEESVANSCLVRKPQLDFNAPNVVHGLTRLNSETERFPLRWLVLSSEPEKQGGATAKEAPKAGKEEPKAEFADSLTLATVKAYDPAFVGQASVQRLIRQDDHAFANLEIDLPRITTTELLCSTKDAGLENRWSLKCGNRRELPKVLGKVVVIGAESASDVKTVLGRRMWGFELQARYIESLLSGDYLRSLPIIFNFVLFAAFVFLIEGLPIILLVNRPHWKNKRFVGYAYPRRRYVWTIFWALAVIVVSVALCLALRYLPPLLVYGDILFVTITRLMYFSVESAEHPFVNAHQRKEHVMSKSSPSSPSRKVPPAKKKAPKNVAKAAAPSGVASRMLMPSNGSSNRPGTEGGTEG